MDRTNNGTEEDDSRWHRAPTLHCTWSPSNRLWPHTAWEVTMSLPTGQKANPGSGRDTAPRTSAYGSSSVQIPRPWACLASAGHSGQPLPVEGSTGHVGHTYLVGAGEGGCSRRRGLSPRRGEDSATSPFPPSVVLDLLQGEMGCRGEEVRRAPRRHRSHQFHTLSIPALSAAAPPVTVSFL